MTKTFTTEVTTLAALVMAGLSLSFLAVPAEARSAQPARGGEATVC